MNIHCRKGEDYCFSTTTCSGFIHSQGGLVIAECSSCVRTECRVSYNKCFGCLFSRTWCMIPESEDAGLTIEAALHTLAGLNSPLVHSIPRLHRSSVLPAHHQPSFIITVSTPHVDTESRYIPPHPVQRCVGHPRPLSKMAALEGRPFRKTNEPWPPQQRPRALLSSLLET
jgi:hypothetical protein